jgi:hypothetical protein
MSLMAAEAYRSASTLTIGSAGGWPGTSTEAGGVLGSDAAEGAARLDDGGFKVEKAEREP